MIHIKKTFILPILLLSFQLFSQTNSQFTVVLDAGHGGDDPGAVRFGLLEKDIALKVVLKVGEILNKYPEIETKYTRKTDVFIELGERARIANKYKANLFVSIHCNSHKSETPIGTETFVMGISKNASNLEVAKKENSVILLEADYKTKYGGYDPNSPESMIGLKLVQEENRDQSINLASKVQDGFTDKLKRVNRGVKEAPLWVLNATYMPSVLIELGFISNKIDSQYIASEAGQNQLASVIAEAIIRYKREFFGGSFTLNEPVVPIKTQEDAKPKLNNTKEVQTEKTNTVLVKGLVYKVQIAASGNKIALQPSNFKGLSPISVLEENKMQKYMYGEFKTLEEAQEAQDFAKSKGYPSAFIVSFENGKKVK
jgi:N-acetylmuramoyl-L-alanine amidase